MVLSANISAVGDAAGAVPIIVENLPVPVDRRVWQEATALHEAGYTVSVICPKGKGYDRAYEQIDGVHIYRHRRVWKAQAPWLMFSNMLSPFFGNSFSR